MNTSTARLRPRLNSNEEEFIGVSEVRPEGRYIRDQKSLWHMKVRQALNEMRYVPKHPSEQWRACRPTAAAFWKAFEFVEGIDRPDLPVPMVVPGSRGSLQLEWYFGKKEVNVRFAANGLATKSKIKNDNPIEDESALAASDKWDLFHWLLAQ